MNEVGATTAAACSRKLSESQPQSASSLLHHGGNVVDLFIEKGAEVYAKDIAMD